MLYHKEILYLVLLLVCKLSKQPSPQLRRKYHQEKGVWGPLRKLLRFWNKIQFFLATVLQLTELTVFKGVFWFFKFMELLYCAHTTSNINTVQNLINKTNKLLLYKVHKNKGVKVILKIICTCYHMDCLIVFERIR